MAGQYTRLKAKNKKDAENGIGWIIIRIVLCLILFFTAAYGKIYGVDKIKSAVNYIIESSESVSEVFARAHSFAEKFNADD